MRFSVMFCLIALAGCGGSPGPTSPSPISTVPEVPSPGPDPVHPPSMISGRLVATNGGQPLVGIGVAVAGLATTTTDGGGQFTVATDTHESASVEFSGPGIVPRRLSLATGAHVVSLDAIQLGGDFSLDFYRQLVRNQLDSPAWLQPVRRWTTNPNIYLRTVFGDNQPLDASSLAAVEATIRSAVPAWTGGRLEVARFERGTGTREDEADWITVVWNGDLGNYLCGQASVGAMPGRIELHPRNEGCRCSGDPGQVSQWVVIHELGHALGYWHTDSRDDAMYNAFNSCHVGLSERERLHGGIAYSRPYGNLDPDSDPVSSVTPLTTTALVR